MSRSNVFDTIQLRAPQRSKFDLSHERKMTIPFGALIPTCVMEVLPGDSVKMDQNLVGRFQALLAPVMHRVDVWTHIFYVPYRILSQDFTRFINYQGNRPSFSQSNSIASYFQLDAARIANVNGAAGNALKDGSLLDYLGFPTAPNDVTLNALGLPWYDAMRFNAYLPLAYQRIWSDYYRDQNFTRPVFSQDGDGQNAVVGGAQYFDQITNFAAVAVPDYEQLTGNSTAIQQLLTLRWRAWQKDYLTTAMQSSAQGASDVRIPITVPAGALGNTPAVGTPVPSAASSFGKTGGIQYPGASGNPSDAGGFTMSAMRIASALKRWLETSLRGGARYTESLWHHWFVKSSDARMQRAEYLDGFCLPMVTSEVVSSAPATSTQPNNPIGYLGGHGISFGKTGGFSRRFEEHGVLMAITSVLPRTSYLYSLPRAFMRSEPLDFAWPAFAQIGEQGILGSEVMFKLKVAAGSSSAPNYTVTDMAQNYAGVVSRFPMGYVASSSYFGFDLQNDSGDGVTTGVGNIWGYQGRYGEYKYLPDTVHGLFRNNLSFWHFGRMFTPNPPLSNTFMTSNPRMDSFAILPSNGGAAGQYNQHPIMLQVYNRISCLRALPYYNTPSLW